jgi:hypothetical protein
MRPVRSLLCVLVLAVAVWFGDRLASSHTWWVFDVPPTQEGSPASQMPRANVGGPLILEMPGSSNGLETDTRGRPQSDPPDAAGVLAELEKSPKPAPVSFSLKDDTGLSTPAHPGPIAVIHAKRILQFRGGKPAPGELERLRTAMIAVGGMWGQPILIFDADGIALSNSPVILYEDDRHDVTSIVLREMRREVAAAPIQMRSKSTY